MNKLCAARWKFCVFVALIVFVNPAHSQGIFFSCDFQILKTYLFLQFRPVDVSVTRQAFRYSETDGSRRVYEYTSNGHGWEAIRVIDRYSDVDYIVHFEEADPPGTGHEVILLTTSQGVADMKKVSRHFLNLLTQLKHTLLGPQHFDQLVSQFSTYSGSGSIAVHHGDSIRVSEVPARQQVEVVVIPQTTYVPYLLEKSTHRRKVKVMWRYLDATRLRDPDVAFFAHYTSLLLSTR